MEAVGHPVRHAALPGAASSPPRHHHAHPLAAALVNATRRRQIRIAVRQAEGAGLQTAAVVRAVAADGATAVTERHRERVILGLGRRQRVIARLATPQFRQLHHIRGVVGARAAGIGRVAAALLVGGAVGGIEAGIEGQKAEAAVSVTAGAAH